MLTSAAVRDTLELCLFKTEELPAEGGMPEGGVLAEGAMLKFGFHAGRLQENRETIRLLLAELSDDFRDSGGEGGSFLNACMDRHGRHWGEHRNIDELLCLGIATGQASFVLPREVWRILPGGMPYFVVKVS